MLKDQLYSLLRKKACVDLELIARLGEVNAQPANFIVEFPQLLQVLGNLTTEYQIKQNPEVKLVVSLYSQENPTPIVT